jgi:hypothetical protein
MTPERRQQLETLMDEITTRELRYSIATQTTAETAQRITDLAQIHTCIRTAFELLSGAVHKRLGEAMVAASMRGIRETDQEQDGRDAAAELLK